MAVTRVGCWTWICSTDKAGSGLLISMLEKLNLFHLNGQITLIVLMWKWMDLFLIKKLLLRCWGCFYLLDWIADLTLSLLLKLPPRKLEPWFVLWSLFLLKLLCIFKNISYGLAWNTVAMCRQFLLKWCL